MNRQLEYIYSGQLKTSLKYICRSMMRDIHSVRIAIENSQENPDWRRPFCGEFNV